MALIAVYGVALLAVVLVSGLAARSVLSTAAIFLVAGALIGRGGFNLVDIGARSPIVAQLADLALFTVLFTDGMRVPLRRGSGTWRQPTRALVVGMPLAFIGVAVLAHYLAGLAWLPALIAGAVLAPTDPVFASAIVGRTDVPVRLRNLLNVESGLNDGLALPVVLVLLAAAGAKGAAGPSIPAVLLELVGGLALGVVLPLAAVALVRLPGLGAEPRLQPLGPFALGALLFGLCHLTHANPYLAAFSAGSVLATASPQIAKVFEQLGDQLSELVKFAAVLVFGALLTPALFTDLTVGAYIVAFLALVLVRPASMVVSLLAGPLSWRERLAAAWFGPKGFASVVYGLLVLQSGVPQAVPVYELVALTIGLSIVAHSSTDVPVARLFGVEDFAGVPAERDRT